MLRGHVLLWVKFREREFPSWDVNYQARDSHFKTAGGRRGDRKMDGQITAAGTPTNACSLQSDFSYNVSNMFLNEALPGGASCR